MNAILILFVGIHFAYAEKHSLKYFYTGVTGGINFPEYTSVGLVDDQQFTYFDSNQMRTVPKTEWIRQNVEADYWDRQTQTGIGHHQNFRVNLQTAMNRFNQSTGVHVCQQMYGCSWDDETEDVDGFDDFGYDGQDFVSLDLKNLRYLTSLPEGVITQVKLNNNQALLESKKQYRTQICIEWLKKYLQYGKNTLQREVSPQVSLLQKDSSSSVICHATGFYPKQVAVSWLKNGQDHNEDVELGELVPNEDGTFQKSSTLNVKPDEWKKNEFSCVVEHKGKTISTILKEDNIWTNKDSNNTIAIVVGCVAVLALLAALIGFIVWKKSNGYKKANASDTDSENSGQQLPQANAN